MSYMVELNGRTLGGRDKVFEVSGKAKAAIAQFGQDAVWNATIGAITNDDGTLAVLPTVADTFRSLAPADFAEYAPISGTPAFLECAKEIAFGSYMPEGFIRAAATPGGTGSLRNAVANYTCPGDIVVTTEWKWAAYANLCKEQGRTLETYPLFTEEGAFHSEAFAAKMDDVFARQPRFLTILNTPAHNPTGYCITDEEWDRILDICRERATEGRKIVLLIDTAYIDFGKDPASSRAFFRKFSHLPENMLILVAASMSKSFTMYGMRCGALLCISSRKEIADEFASAMAFSSRATWSNCNRAAMTVVSRIWSDPALRQKADAERAQLRQMLHRRGNAFAQAADEIGLPMLPFSAGFFCVVPCEKPDQTAELLLQDRVFALALEKGLRISIASLPESKCRELPALLQARIRQVNG